MIRAGVAVVAVAAGLVVAVAAGLLGDVTPVRCVRAPCPQPLTLARVALVVSFNAATAGVALMMIGLLREMWRRRGQDGFGPWAR